MRADSFVMETNIHYPTESSLIRDGLEKILSMCAELAATGNLTGWRQHDHLWKKVKSLSRKIDRIALKKGPNYVARMKVPYRELLQKAQQITERARQLCLTPVPADRHRKRHLRNAHAAGIYRSHRTRDGHRKATRAARGNGPQQRQTLQRVRASYAVVQTRQSGRARFSSDDRSWCIEDAAGFIVHRSLMPRDQCDSQVAVEETKIVQQRFDNRVQTIVV